MSEDMYTFDFDEPDRPLHAVLGGKCTSLVTMTAAGARVPPGFAVTTHAYDAAIGPRKVELRETVASLDPADPAGIAAAATRAQRLVTAQPVPDGVRADVASAYRHLVARCGDDARVAVRSSATAEDLSDASFAGQQETYLWVSGIDEVLDRVRDCWASLYTARAISYRLANSVPEDGLSMAVAVQKMVNARTAGVAMTIDPATGDRSKIVVESSWGLGELVVSGKVTPDQFVLDKVMLSVLRRVMSDKAVELVAVRDGSGLVQREVDAERRSVPSLSDAELTAVGQLAKAVERHYGCPQDIEWAIDGDLPAPDNIVLLQARPETVWSRRVTPRAATSMGAGVESMARTLLSRRPKR